MSATSKCQFPADLCVIHDSDGLNFIITGEPDNPNAIEADDGDEVAIYHFSGLKRFRRATTLEEIQPPRRRRRR